MWKETSILESPIVEYVRDNRGNRKGVLVSGVLDGTVVIGWSLCSKLDIFDKREGFFIAEGRAIENDRIAARYTITDDYKIPRLVEYQLIDFVARIKRYYKSSELSKFAKMFDI